MSFLYIKSLHLDYALSLKCTIMEILLPSKNDNSKHEKLINPKAVTIIGANGSGKSRFGDEIERTQKNASFRISAFNALCTIPDEPVKPGSIRDLYKKTLDVSPYVARDINSEFEQLIFLLLNEELRSLIIYKDELKQKGKATLPRTRFDKTKELWESIFPKNKLMRIAGKLLIHGNESTQPYNALRMSQGEKVVFYLIAATLYAEKESVILVDDPEMFLHNSVIKNLWDSIEQLRTDCTFIYLTHDIEFASSRSDGKCVWIKSFDAEHITWDYEFIDAHGDLPEAVYLDILGSRKPVLFIEGTDNSSIDIKLYPHIFPEYLVKPLGGCTRVIETTRAFAELKSFHHLESKGIVDRDRRTRNEIAYLRERNVFVPEVAEVENLLMLEAVIRTVARRMMQNPENVFRQVRDNVIALFSEELEEQALLHTRHRIRRQLEYTIDRRVKTIDELSNHINNLTADIDSKFVFKSICNEFRGFVRDKDYSSILRVYNQKGMLPQSKVAQLCGLSGKEKYLSFVLSILKENKADAAYLRKAIKACFGLN